MADTKQIDWGDGTGEKITVTAASFVGNKGLQISSPENVKVTPRSKTIVLKSKTDPTKVARINVTQEKAVYTYNFSLTPSVELIAAKGGTSVITAQLKTYRNGNLVSTETITPQISGTATGFSISGTTVTASSRGTTVGNSRSILIEGSYSGTFDGQIVTASATVYQEANRASYGSLEGGRLSVGDIPASGGTSFTNVTNMSQVITYTSGATGAGKVTYSKSAQIVAPSLGVTVRARTKVGQVKVTFTGEGGATAHKSVDVYQQANYIESLKIGGGSTTQYLPSTLTYSAAGGSNPFTGWAVYTSGSELCITTFQSGDWVLSQSYFTKSLSGGILTVSGEYRGVTVGPERTATLTVNLKSEATNNKQLSAFVTLTQAANVETNITYGNINITYFTYPDIPASGGSVSPKLAYTQAKIQNYSSGGSKNIDTISSGATLTYSKSGTAGGGSINPTTGVVSVGSRGITVGSRWEVGRFIVAIKLNGKETSTNVVCYQEANEATSISYGVPTVNLTVSDIPASGGSTSSGIVTYSQSRTQNYTSGATSALSALTTGGTVSYSSAVSASSLGTTVKARTKVGTLTATVFMNGQSGSKVADVYQQANNIDSYTYGTWEITISANSTRITYSGGQVAVGALCSRSKTPVYTSGALGTSTTETARPSVTGSASGFTFDGDIVTASKNSWAAPRSIVITASYPDAISKSITITQDAAPASISLNKTTLAFSQRASSNTVQVTCNSDWNINSNVEFAIPDTLEIKYNPNTDIVELVDQPYQITKKVQESNDYVLALVRIGAFRCSTYLDNRTKAPSREEVRDEKNSAGYKNRNQLYLLTKTQDKSYHRIVGRQWFRDGNATSQIAEGQEGQAKLYTADMLITKPGKVVGIRGCELSVPLLKLAEKLGRVRPASSVSWNDKTGRITFTTEREVNTGSSSQPRMSMVAQTSNNGPIGYILFKKKSTTQYLDVHGWEEVSNFTLARVLIDTNFVVKQLGSQFAVTVVFQYGED